MRNDLELYETFYKNGNKHSRGHIVKSYEPGGECGVDYDFDPHQWSLDNLKDGVWTTWYKSGQKKFEGGFLCVEEATDCIDNLKDGIWTYWDEEGNVIKTETYKDGGLVK